MNTKASQMVEAGVTPMSAAPAASRRGGPNPLILGDTLTKPARRPWVMAAGSLEATKWLALVLMTLDHANKYLYREALPALFEVGRVVMPLFGFVLAYNLARPGALAAGVHRRMAMRLTWMGLAAAPVCVMLNATFVGVNPWWPLNILFMLLLVVALTYLIERGGAARCGMAMGLFVVGGAVVEYFWLGVLCCLGAWAFCRKATLPRLLLWLSGTLSLSVVNANTDAVVAIPIVLLLGQVSFPLKRRTWVFYGFYPAHLLLLLLIQRTWFPHAH